MRILAAELCRGSYAFCVEWDYDFRLQKIGNKYRAFRRFSDNWKGKGMSQRDEDIELTPRMKLWCVLMVFCCGSTSERTTEALPCLTYDCTHTHARTQQLLSLSIITHNWQAR